MPEPQSTDLNPEIRRIVDAARGVWTRRLIDHFRANSLLFYRDLKVGTIDLTAETEAVGRLLAGDTLTVERLVSPARHAGNPDPVVRARAEAEASQKVRGALVALQRKALSNLEAFLIAVGTNETLEHPVHAVIEPVRSFDGDSTKDWCARHLESDAEVCSDGLFCFRRFADAGHAHAHAVLGTGGGCAACEVKGARWVNVLLGNVKRAISGSYHAIRQGKYARLYLAEAAYRFNRRFRLREMLPRLARAMMLCKRHPEPVLRMASNFMAEE